MSSASFSICCCCKNPTCAGAHIGVVHCRLVGTVRPGPVQLGTVQPGTVKPGTVKLGTVLQPGTVSTVDTSGGRDAYAVSIVGGWYSTAWYSKPWYRKPDPVQLGPIVVEHDDIETWDHVQHEAWAAWPNEALTTSLSKKGPLPLPISNLDCHFHGFLDFVQR